MFAGLEELGPRRLSGIPGVIVLAGTRTAGSLPQVWGEAPESPMGAGAGVETAL